MTDFTYASAVCECAKIPYNKGYCTIIRQRGQATCEHKPWNMWKLWTSTSGNVSCTRAFRVNANITPALFSLPSEATAMEYEKCYVFQSEDALRPTKRRKVDDKGLQASWALRKTAYATAWQRQKDVIDQRLEATNSHTIRDLQDFLISSAQDTPNDRIPTAIVSAGRDAATQQGLVEKLKQSDSGEEARAFVSLAAASASNLKAALKIIIQKATAQNVGLDEDEDLQISSSKGPKLLNYDLQILCDHVKERNLSQIVLCIEDTEAFNSDLLSDLIEILGCWNDRIPFVFLLSVATSLDFLQQRISRDAVKCLAGRMFAVAPSEDEIERVMDAITGHETSIWLGPSLLSAVLERQSDYIQSIDGFREAVHYAYMSCYYANALSIFLGGDAKLKDIPKDHFEAARNTQSFRTHCRALLDQSNGEAVRELLDSDAELLHLLSQSIQQGFEALRSLRAATILVADLLKHLQGQPKPVRSKLYLQALSGKLQGSSLLRSMLLSIRKATSATAVQLIGVFASAALPETVRDQGTSLKEELTKLMQSRPHANQPLRSEDDVKNSTLRTTVVSQKIELSKQKSTLSKEDAAYTVILRRITDLLEEYFADVLINPKDLMFHEIFLYDLKSPHREAFTPRPRHAIERALATPHDYLDCECCAPQQGEDEEATLSATQPATAIVYQLYLESGSLVNASDLWQAFQAVMGEETNEEENMALFERALTELQYLGMVKSTRKKADHVAKVAWRGL